MHAITVVQQRRISGPFVQVLFVLRLNSTHQQDCVSGGF